MTPAELSIVRRMSQQERMAHFGKLCGQGKITWKELSYIVKEIPYENNRRLEDTAIDKESGALCSDNREQRGLGDAVHDRRLRQAGDTIPKGEVPDAVELHCGPLVQRSTDGSTDGHRGEEDFERKVKDIATLFSAG